MVATNRFLTFVLCGEYGVVIIIIITLGGGVVGSSDGGYFVEVGELSSH